MSNIKNEINFNKQDMHAHFSTIASKYRSVRTLDTKPISYIKDKLKEKSKIKWHDENILLEIRK